MGNIEVKMNSAGALALLNSPEVQADLASRAERIRNTAESMTPRRKSWMYNPNYVVKSGPGASRASAAVIAANPGSIRENLKNNTLIKALGSGR